MMNFLKFAVMRCIRIKMGIYYALYLKMSILTYRYYKIDIIKYRNILLVVSHKCYNALK